MTASTLLDLLVATLFCYFICAFIISIIFTVAIHRTLGIRLTPIFIVRTILEAPTLGLIITLLIAHTYVFYGMYFAELPYSKSADCSIITLSLPPRIKPLPVRLFWQQHPELLKLFWSENIFILAGSLVGVTDSDYNWLHLHIRQHCISGNLQLSIA